MTIQLVLAFPNSSILFIIEIDTFKMVIGVVLLQDKHPLAFLSKKSTPLIQKISTYVRKLYAIIEVVGKWQQYLL